ncbi:MAG TPA: hypothetical protein VEB21_02930 [Terriglobales bacterium]|nr:hypothetical protein [Terriglobales bacterium]
MFRKLHPSLLALALSSVLLTHCASDEPGGVAESESAATTVKHDFFHKPLPEIPLPNDLATVFDATSATGRRVNASMIAPTFYERRTRELIDQLDGWGIFQAITIPFSGPLDVDSILAGHRDPDYDPSNDVVYLIDIDRDSKEFGKLHHLDLGNGNYPVVLEDRFRYWDNDPRGGTMSILFEEVDEDLNRNGVLDPGEDTDADGILDQANYLPGEPPASDDVAARADALMTFYERETNTLIARPLVPLRERTTYAVVVTKRLKDANGDPVGSPFPNVNHTVHSQALEPLPEVLPEGVRVDDVAFAFTFTTQSIESHWVAVREGLYGHGVQAHLGQQYPAKVDQLFDLRDAATITHKHLFYGESFRDIGRLIVTQFLGLDLTSVEFQLLDDGLKYVDYFVVGSYQSPQLFPRRDKDGNLLHLDDQSWPPDLDSKPAATYPETIYFTLSIPRKEVSARGEGKPVPVAILSHGYGSNRFPVMQFAGYFAKHGMATISIDGPSHGIEISPQEENLARAILGSRGFGGLAEATFLDRAFDQDNDGEKDSGADFWVSYLFHCRDMVRQFMLDYSQLVRVMRGWDGERHWDFDLGNDGVADLAGDFDGDGVVDISDESVMLMTGGSLGGIMSMLMGGAEPAISTVVPIAGGGGYSDMGMRTTQGGALEAFALRAMGPLYIGNLDGGGNLVLDTIFVDLNDDRRVRLGSIANVSAGDTMVVENLVSGARGCGLVTAAGRSRASLESDRNDRIRIAIYPGQVLIPGTLCEVAAGVEPKGVLDQHGQDFTYHGQEVKAGDPLRAVEDGLGRARNTPELRRMQGLAQMVLDPADPASFARFLLKEPLAFPFTKEQTQSHVLVLTSQGDMNVPAASGVTFGRAAGLIEYLEPDPRYGVPENQVLLDTYTAEAVDNLGRFTDSSGKGVHLDVEHFSEGMNDIWGPSYPRLEERLHGNEDFDDGRGGKSAAFFPLVHETGQHGFNAPGNMVDLARRQCRESCTQTGGSDPCNCRTLTVYDVGTFLINMSSDYLASDGTRLNLDLCHTRGDCPEILPPPPPRQLSELP